MEKFFDKLILKINSKIAIGFKLCFPVLKWFVGLCNGLLVLLGGVVLGACVIMYSVPRLHLFLDALKHIFNVHTIFGSAIVLGALTVCIGIVGLWCLSKGYYNQLGLQASSFLVILIVMSAITFSFWTEWEENAHFGISYATQSYNPKDSNSLYFKSIQEFMSCCGSKGPGDYDIANEYFKPATAPIACCNRVKYPTNCTKIHNTSISSHTPQAISVHLAYDIGCMTKMEKVIWPIIVYLIFIHSGLAFVCMLTSAVLIIGYQSCMIPCASQKKKNSRINFSEYEDEETLKLELKQ